MCLVLASAVYIAVMYHFLAKAIKNVFLPSLLLLPLEDRKSQGSLKANRTSRQKKLEPLNPPRQGKTACWEYLNWTIKGVKKKSFIRSLKFSDLFVIATNSFLNYNSPFEKKERRKGKTSPIKLTLYYGFLGPEINLPLCHVAHWKRGDHTRESPKSPTHDWEGHQDRSQNTAWEK